jgi:uncharacterized protein YggE
MRSIRLLCTALVPVIALAACSDGSGSAAAAAEDTTKPGTITAQGTGKVRGVPDLLVVDLGVHTEAAKAADALKENNVRSQALRDQITAKGVADEDVRTTNVSISATYDDKGKIRGYAVDNALQLRLHDLASAGITLDEVATSAGDAARIFQVAFTFDDDTKLIEEARADAVKRAKAQAKQLADAAGVELGKVRTISELSPQDQVFATTGAAAGGFSGDAVSLSPGSQELTFQVTLVYDIA